MVGVWLQAFMQMVAIVVGCLMMCIIKKETPVVIKDAEDSHFHRLTGIEGARLSCGSLAFDRGFQSNPELEL